MGIANYVDQESKCWPSLETLSKKLGMSKQSVIANLDGLIESELITKERNDHYGVNIYTLKWPDAEKKAKRKTVQNSLTETVKESGLDQFKNLELKQLKNFDSNLISKNPTKKPNAAHALATEIIDWWCREYLLILKDKYLIQWNKEISLIKLLLKQYSQERIKEVALCLLRTSDPFYLKNRTIGFLYSQWNKIAAQNSRSANLDACPPAGFER